MYLQQYEVSMTILDYFYPRLKNYIDFDFTDQLSPPRLKKDGNYYATYVSEIRQEHAVLSPDRCSVVLKEIPASLTEIYRKISSRWSPYIETVYGVLSENGHSLAINEFIQKPACLSYPTKELLEMRSLTGGFYSENAYTLRKRSTYFPSSALRSSGKYFGTFSGTW